MKKTEVEKLARTFQQFGRTPEQCEQMAREHLDQRDRDYITQNGADIDEIFTP